MKWDLVCWTLLANSLPGSEIAPNADTMGRRTKPGDTRSVKTQKSV